MSNSTAHAPSLDHRVERAAPAPSRALHAFAVVAAAATFVLIFVGALVTSTGSAMAVPDWPLAFGRLVPNLTVAGVRFEYGHRLAAAAVVILTVILALWIWRVEERAWLRYTALGAVGLIIVQAVLGGITVRFELPLPVAVAHAGTGQALFCVMVALAAFTGPRWLELTPRPDRPGRVFIATLSAITTAVVYVQILVGALMRHMGAALAIPDFPLSFGRLVPPAFTDQVAVNFAHRCGTLLLTALVVWTSVGVFRAYRDEPLLRRPAIGVLVLLVLQVSLGAMTIWSHRAVLPTTAHVAVGAAVLATSFTLTLRLYRLNGPVPVAGDVASPLSQTQSIFEPKVTA
jgi:cytochrome c oxidase assembly protein subunit 15